MGFLIMLLPWLELLTLVELGILTSGLTVLVYVFVTVVLGMAILRRQGRGMFERLRQAQDGRIIGPELLLDDMALGFAGLLLIFPGMISDLVALIVMIGPLRRRLANALIGPQAEAYIPERDASGHETIEGVYRQVDDENNS